MIKRALLALLYVVLAIAPAQAQLGPSTNGPMYNPNWSLGYVPTPAQWGLMWSNKMDYFPNGLPVKYGGTGATTLQGVLSAIGALSASMPSGQIYVGSNTGVGTLRTLGGDCSLSNLGSITCTKTNGVSLGYFATGTDAANLTGTVANARLVNSGTVTVNGQPCTLGSSCTVTAAATGITVGATTVTSGTSNGVLYNNGGTLGNLATANSGVLVTSGAGVPSVSTTLPSGLAMGTPSAINLSNATAMPLSGVTGTLAPANGGTGASALTTGSVPFIGASGVYTQDNTNLYWDNTNKSLNIAAGGGVVGQRFRVNGNLSGSGGAAYNIVSQPTIQSDVTGGATINYTGPSTAAASFTMGSLQHYVAAQGTFGAGSTVTNQYGFVASSNLSGATNNYGFYGGLTASGTSRYNLWMAGNAPNYMAGPLGIGTSPAAAGFTLDVNGNANGNVISRIYNASTAASSTSVAEINAGGRGTQLQANYTGSYVTENPFGGIATRYSNYDSHQWRTNAGLGQMSLGSNTLTLSHSSGTGTMFMQNDGSNSYFRNGAVGNLYMGSQGVNSLLVTAQGLFSATGGTYVLGNSSNYFASVTSPVFTSQTGSNVGLYAATGFTAEVAVSGSTNKLLVGTGAAYPSVNGVMDLGGSGNRWASYYGVNGDFTGNLTAVTQASSDNSNKVATTAFTQAVVAASSSGAVPGLLTGYTLSTAGSSSTFGVAAGYATDSTATTRMRLASAYTKTTGAWTVGSGNGCLDTGTIANNTWYSVYAIQTTALTTVDVLCSTSATAPTMPASYTYFRRIGSMKTNGSAQWATFVQKGDYFYITSVVDFNAGGTSAATLRTLSVPTGVVVQPLVSAYTNTVNNGVSTVQVAPAANSATLIYLGQSNNGNGFNANTLTSFSVGPPTNTSGQIYVAIPSFDQQATLYTSGWIDTRGKD